jgi:dolichol-phosphate mannosyltransferase
MAVAIVILIAAVVLMPTIAAGLLLLLSVFTGLAGLQLLAVGIVGEYVWRALDEAKRRPAYLIEAMAGQQEPAKLQ